MVSTRRTTRASKATADALQASEPEPEPASHPEPEPETAATSSDDDDSLESEEGVPGPHSMADEGMQHSPDIESSERDVSESDVDDDIDPDTLGEDEWPATPPPAQPTPRAARTSEWPPEKNLALARALEAHQPHTARHGSVTAAWTRVKDDLNTVGYNFKGLDAIQKHASMLIAAQRKLDSDAAKKSGANEEVTPLMQIMAKIVSDIDDHRLEKEQTSSRARAKASAERVAGAQMREAAMRGCVDREELVDAAAIEGATTREKQGQRKKQARRKRTRGISPDSDKENSGQTARKRAKTMHVPDNDDDDDMVTILQEMNAADEAMLQEVRAAQREQEKKQGELLGKLDELIKVTVAGQQQSQSADSRRDEWRERQQDFLQMYMMMQQLPRQN